MNLAKPSTYHSMKASVGLDNGLFEVPLSILAQQKPTGKGKLVLQQKQTNTLSTQSDVRLN